MQAVFPWATDWLDQIPKSKWTQACGEGKQYDHMTINIAKCMNSILKGARTLPITTLVNETFNKINDLFATNDMKIMNMINIGHRYSEEVYVMMQENRHIAYVALCSHVRVAMTCTVKLNEWSCDCKEFQALWIPCSHVIATCASCNLNYDNFVDPKYKLENIYKVYQHHFHSLGSEDKWPQYLGSYFILDPSKRRETSGR